MAKTPSFESVAKKAGLSQARIKEIQKNAVKHGTATKTNKPKGR